MKRLDFVLSLATIVADVRVPGFQVSGAFYRYLPGAATPPPIAGASVYIRPLPVKNDVWLGPSVTDSNGRYTFIAVPAGRYLLQAFISSSFLWQQTFDASNRPIPAVVCAVHEPRTTVVCYKERTDWQQVVKLFRDLGYQNVLLRAGTQSMTNIVRFGSGVPLEDVTLVGSAFVAAGLRIRAIRRFSSDTPANGDVIESGTDPSLKGPALTIASIQSARDFPRGSPGERTLSFSDVESAQIKKNIASIPTPPDLPQIHR
ncbi:MAG: hypothetical protein JO036_17035 [Candidatus Eremiobacteraeota bacterium]|nr:hypothetical protein [Candidatus Eremiobacteraeota bacterium]